MLNTVINPRALVLMALLASLCLPLNAQEGVDAQSISDGNTEVTTVEATASDTSDLKAAREESTQNFVERKENATPLSERVEDLKKAALELNRDLLILEEDLLFPANTQVAIYVSVDIGKFFSLDAIRLMIDGEMVSSHLYTQKQNSALVRGGVQRLYLGNLKTGQHQITAFFHGYGPEGREYKRGASFTLNKDQSPTMLEIRIQDWITRMQPTFKFKEWHL